MKNTTFFEQLKSIFLSGFFAIFPITATIVVVNFLYKTCAPLIAPLKILLPPTLREIPGSEFLITILIIMIVGILVRFFIINPIIHYLEHIIAKIPFIKSIYSAAKAVVDFFAISQEEQAARKVVLINFPRKEYSNVAFLLGSAQAYKQYLPSTDEEYVRVFLPTSPTPGTGYFLILPRSEVIETNLTFEEAIKIIVSCGVIAPDSAHIPMQQRLEDHHKGPLT